MPEYLAPGVYVEEVETGAKPIEGVSTSTSGMVGVTERGPVGVATLVTSYPDFVRQFGGYLDDRVYTGARWYLPHAVEGFFTNGGKRLYAVRVLPDEATAAERMLFDRGDTADAGGATFTRFDLSLVARVAESDQVVFLDDVAGLAIGGGQWAKIEDGKKTEYVRFAVAPTGVVFIGRPIRASLLRAGTLITALDAGGNPAGTSQLAADVLGGEFILPVRDPGAFAGAVRFQIAAGALQEIPAISQVQAVRISVPLSLNHNPVPFVRPLTWTDPVPDRRLTAPASGTDTITLNDRTRLAGTGQRLRLTNADGGTEEAQVIAITDPRVRPGPDPGAVTLADTLLHDYEMDDRVEVLDAPPWTDPEDRRATAFTAGPPQALTVTNRVGLVGAGAPGAAQEIRVRNLTTGAPAQIVRIQAVPNPQPALNPGDIQLDATTPLTLAINFATDTVVVELLDPPLNTVAVPRLSLDPVRRTLTGVPSAPNTLPLSDRTSLAVGQQLRVTNVTTGVLPEVVTIQTIPGAGGPPPDAGNVTLTSALGITINPGNVVQVELVTAIPRILTRRAMPGHTQVTLDNRVGIPDPPAPGIAVTRVPILEFLLGGESEFVRVAAPTAPRGGGTDPGVVTLARPLQRRYPAGTAVTLHVDTSGDTNPSFLAWDVDPGDRALLLGADAAPAYGPGTVLRLDPFASETAEYVQVAAAAPTPVLRVLDAPLQEAHPAGVPVLGRNEFLRVQAIDRGAWGNRLRVTVEEEDRPLLSGAIPVGDFPAAKPSVILQTAVGIEPGSILEFEIPTGGPIPDTFRQKVVSVTGNAVGFGLAGVQRDVPRTATVRTVEFQMRVELVQINPRTNLEETIRDEQFNQMSFDPRHSRYVVKVIGPIFVSPDATPRRSDGRTEGESTLVRVRDMLYQDWPRDNPMATVITQAVVRPGPDVLTFTPPGGTPATFGGFLRGGDDAIGQIKAQTYIGTDSVNPPDRRGIHALKNVEEISIVAVPGQTDQSVQQRLLEHCESMRYRVAVLDSIERATLTPVQDQRSLYDSKYGAIYYPWLRIADPFPDNPRVQSQVSIPSSGHVMGIYARSDIERGVHKAPANEVIRGVLDLEVSLTKEEQDILNPRNINAHRNFRRINRGLRVWGARTISSDPDWKYINVRRVFIFVERSIEIGTQWVVFEPNDERLWARVRRTITDFLTTVWRNGALQGVKPEEGFFVKCDRETMSDDDINNGRLIVMVGLAVVRPAEFVIFRIGQSRRGAQLFEG